MKRPDYVRIGVYSASLLVAACLLLTASADPRPDCERAKGWVEAHKGSLPQSLPAIAALPGVYRRAVFSQLPPVNKSELWKERLEQAAALPNLTDGQREVVRQAQALVTPALYDDNPLLRTKLPDAWMERAKREFPSAQSQLITELGDGDGSFSTLQSTRVKLASSVNHLAIALTRPGTVLANPTSLLKRPDCQCTTEAPEFGCGSGTICCGYNVVCIAGDGCGPLGGSICEGLCRVPSHPNCQF